MAMDRELMAAYVVVSDRARAAKKVWEEAEAERRDMVEQVVEEMRRHGAMRVAHGDRKIDRRTSPGGFSYRRAIALGHLKKKHVKACFVGEGKEFLVVR